MEKSRYIWRVQLYKFIAQGLLLLILNSILQQFMWKPDMVRFFKGELENFLVERFEGHIKLSIQSGILTASIL